MASTKQKQRRRKRDRHLVQEGQVAPGIWQGLTQGVPKEEALRMHPVAENRGGVVLASNLRDIPDIAGTRIPTPRFVASENPDAFMIEENTGRVMQDAVIHFTAEVLDAVKAGNICLRCHEPQPFSFPEMCDVCGYPMRERQIMDISMEFVGERHVGPAKPVKQYLEEMDERTEKRRFIDKLMEGGQGKVPREWLNDRTLFPDGPPTQVV